jgi:hypothetical protein
MLLKHLTHLAKVDLRPRLIGSQDQGSMSLDPFRVPISAHRLGRNLTLLPEAGVPANGARCSDTETLRSLSTRCSRLDGGNHSLAQVQ